MKIFHLIIILTLFHLSQGFSQISGYWKLTNKNLSADKSGYKIVHFNSDTTYYFLSKSSTIKNPKTYQVDLSDEKFLVPLGIGNNNEWVSFKISQNDSIRFTVKEVQFVFEKINSKQVQEFSDFLNKSNLLIDLPYTERSLLSEKQLTSFLNDQNLVRFDLWFSVASSFNELPQKPRSFSKYSKETPTKYRIGFDSQIYNFNHLKPEVITEKDTALLYKRHKIVLDRRVIYGNMAAIVFIDKSVPFKDFAVLLREIRFIPYVGKIFFAFEKKESEHFEIGYFQIQETEYPIAKQHETFGDWCEEGMELKSIGSSNFIEDVRIVPDEQE
jgi:hypothetical protein